MYTLSLGVRWSKRWDTEYGSEFFLSPALENASETTIGLKDVKFGGGGLLRRDAGPVTVGLGATWTRAFGRALLLPVLEIDLRTTADGLTAHALIPLEASLRFHAAPWLEVGLLLQQQGGEYRADDEDIDAEEWVRYWSTTLGPSISVKLGGAGLHLFSRGGVEFRRRFDGIEPDGSRIRRELEGARMLQLAILYGDSAELGAVAPAQGWRWLVKRC